MSGPSKRTVQLAARFLEIANRYTAEGWIEYLLWETLEGKRDRPFPFLEPLASDEQEALRALRDEANIWFAWSNNRWAPVPIDQWRAHAEQRSAKDVCDELHAKGTG